VEVVITKALPQSVMRGQKRVEDARERAYTPASISFEKSLYKARWIAGSSPAMTPPANPRGCRRP
jgi:hypothetical protein